MKFLCVDFNRFKVRTSIFIGAYKIALKNVDLRKNYYKVSPDIFFGLWVDFGLKNLQKMSQRVVISGFLP